MMELRTIAPASAYQAQRHTLAAMILRLLEERIFLTYEEIGNIMECRKSYIYTLARGMQEPGPKFLARWNERIGPAVERSLVYQLRREITHLQNQLQDKDHTIQELRDHVGTLKVLLHSKQSVDRQP